MLEVVIFVMETFSLVKPSSVSNVSRESRLEKLATNYTNSPAHSYLVKKRTRVIRGQISRDLFNLDSGAGVLELFLDGQRFFLGHSFLNGLRSALHEILGFLQAQAGNLAHYLDHVDLLIPHGGEDNAEFGLLLGRRLGFASRRRNPSGGHRHGSSRANSVLL